MRLPARVRFAAALLLVLAGALAVGSAAAQQPAVVGPGEFTIGGAVTMPLTISLADFKKLPRAMVRVPDARTQKDQVYEGVPLATLLQKAGAPQGEQIRGPWMTAYVTVEAADGYKAVFSLAELDSGFLDSNVLVADMLDGAPLPAAGQGPFKLVAPHDKRPARWVRMLKSITVVRPAN